MSKLAICITTFLRDDLLYKTIQSVVARHTKDCVILVGDQGRGDDKKAQWITDMEHKLGGNFFYRQFPFDCGLSAGRNRLVQLAKEKGCDLCLISADSIAFKDMRRLSTVIASVLEAEFDLIGLNLENRIPWEAKTLNLIEGDSFELDFLRTKRGQYNDHAVGRTIDKNLSAGRVVDGVVAYPCELVKNFFVARTDALLASPWDENLKLFEHEDFFYRFKQAGFKVAWTPDVTGEYVDHKPADYNRYRQRMYTEFKAILQKKYGIKGWITYKNYFS